MIVSIEPGPDVETACIAVSSDSRTYLAGERMIPTHNTQEKFWTYQEHSGQQWIYDTAPFVWDGPLSAEGRWVSQNRGTYVGRAGGPCEGKPAALLIHMPSKGGPVELVELDLEYGGQVAHLAESVVRLRDQGKRAGGICPA